MVTLTIVDPEGKERHLDLTADEYVVGREPSCDIQLPSGKVSRQHARIYRRGNDYWVEDSGSANGVRIEGAKIDGPRRLIEHEFRIAKYTLRADIKETTEFVLQALSKPFKGQRYALEKESVSVGRGKNADITLAHKSVSRKHAALDVHDNEVHVRDLGSSNGTFINNERVDDGVLRVGDEICFGRIRMQVRDANASSKWPDWHDIAAAARRQRMPLLVGSGVFTVLMLLAVGVAAFWGSPQAASSAARIKTDAEIAYEKSIGAHLEHAERLLGEKKWRAASNALREALALDPINRRARRSLENAEANLRHARLLDRSKTAMRSGNLEQALTSLKAIPASSHHGARALGLARKVRRMLAEQALEDAKDACEQEDWRRCHERAVLHLESFPESMKGHELVARAEKALRGQGVRFTPYSPPKKSPQHAVVQRYPREVVREAALRYAQGDLNTALAKAASLQTDAARELAKRLKRSQNTKTAADGAAVAGEHGQAIAGWKKALAIDAELLPRDYPSAFRQQLRARLAELHNHQAQAAFDRGAYADALRRFQKSRQALPDNDAAAAGIQRLVDRATALLKAAKDKPGSSCGKLRQIRDMTPKGTPVHKEARRLLAGCDG